MTARSMSTPGGTPRSPRGLFSRGSSAPIVAGENSSTRPIAHSVSALTHWVLAHKKTVVLTGIVLTIAGMAAAGPASTPLLPMIGRP